MTETIPPRDVRMFHVVEAGAKFLKEGGGQQ
jgi:hypothetical protein